MNIYNIEERVKRILQEEPQTRNSDELLISKVDESINPAVSILPYFEVMANRKKYGLPSCESIRRCRQKLQAKATDLRATDRVRRHRSEKKEEFEEYARA